MEEDEIVVHDIKLHELSARYIGETIRTEVAIVGESNKKAVPEGYDCFCLQCNQIVQIFNYQLAKCIDILIKGKQITSIVEKLARNEMKIQQTPGMQNQQNCPHRKIVVDESDAYINIRILKVKEIVDYTADLDVDIYNDFNAYALDVEIPRVKRALIEARVIVEHSGKGIALAITRMEPLEENNTTLSKEDIEQLNFYFRDNSHLEDDIDAFLNPYIFQRRMAKQATLLTLFSPLQLPNGDRGVIHSAFIGDTKCAKSKIARVGVVENLGIGEDIIVETASRTGIAYTIDPELKYLIWGVLPQNHGGYVCLDGLQRMDVREMSEFREVLESGMIRVRRLVSGDAPAQVRLIACLNPKRPLMDYLYRCDAIKKSNCFEDEPDITRWDFFVFFAEDDVAKEIIAKGRPLNSRIPIDLFKKKLYWIWSRTKEQIQFEEDVESEINTKSLSLMDEFATPKVPLVHNGSKQTMIRTAVAVANKYNSMDDKGENIIVKKEHVEESYNFLKSMYFECELFEKKQREFEKVNITVEVMDMIKQNERYAIILNNVADNYVASDNLGKIMDISKRTIKNDAAFLMNEKLIYSKQGKGYRATTKGKRLLRRLKNDECSKTTLLNKNMSPYTEKQVTKIFSEKKPEIVQTNYTSTNIDNTNTNSIITKEDSITNIDTSQNEQKTVALDCTSQLSDRIVKYNVLLNNGKYKTLSLEEIQQKTNYDINIIREDMKKLCSDGVFFSLPNDKFMGVK